MKRSRYNFLVRTGDGRTLAYNALSNGLCLVDEPVARFLRTGDGWEELEEGLREELRRGGFVVPEGLDERDVVRVRYRLDQYAGTALAPALTIAPTLDCNLACRYCFENPDRGMMDAATADAVVEFAGRLLPSRGGALSVTWYGGEPLLAMEVIEGLGARLQELCASRDARWSAGIVTNGTRLDEATAARLRELGVTEAQVTIDGPRAVHDRRRPLRGGGGSFDRILANLPGAVRHLALSIRVNVDRENAGEVFSLVEELAGQEWFDPQRVGIYLGYVRRYTPSCGCSVEEMLEAPEYWELSDRLTERLRRAGVRVSPPYPELAGGCTATRWNSFVIGPRGELYRCWNHVGDPAMVTGNVRDPLAADPLTVSYLVDGFEGDRECLECRFLPVCAGGCVDVRRKARDGLLPRKDCARWRYGFGRHLEGYLRAWEAEQRTAGA